MQDTNTIRLFPPGSVTGQTGKYHQFSTENNESSQGNSDKTWNCLASVVVGLFGTGCLRPFSQETLSFISTRVGVAPWTRMMRYRFRLQPDKAIVVRVGIVQRDNIFARQNCRHTPFLILIFCGMSIA
jgi:hypothetical protein